MANYTPDLAGQHLAVVRGGVVLMLPASSAALVADLWPRLVEADPVRVVLDRLTVEGLSATPSFGLVVRADEGDGVRVVVRGGFSVRLGAETITGEGVSTWVERAAEGTAVELRATDAAGGPAAAASAAASKVDLPIVEGVVFATSVGSESVEPVATVPEPVARPGRSASDEPLPTTEISASAEPSGLGAQTAAAPSAEPAAPPTTPTEQPVPSAWAPPVGGSTGSTIPGPPPPPAQAPTPDPVYDAIDDSTIVSPVGAAIGAPAGAPIQPPVPPAPAIGVEQTIVPTGDTYGGDHDGMTVVGADLQRLRAERDARRAEQTTVPDAPGRPTASGAVASPKLSLRMPDGSLEPVTHEVLLGRAPSVSQVSGGRLPRVVAIGAGDQDISRTHVRVTVEGDTVVITDLHSRNGTHVAQPGKAPVRLRAGEPTPVLVGTVVDLGGGWTIQVVAD
ncbi:FHA domain-containing protein [Agromyces allii]|uniref:FHA domain-containing protein n=1 Tax=Agromyces allii TaxID=393607 RepID=A0ABP5BP58_9MICO|nr:FHA domain-containing protein [Agromyces allii]